MLIFFIILFLILSALFSGSEIAFISANKLSVEVKKNKGSRRSSILAKFYDKPKDFLGTMLIGNSIALVVFTYCMTKLLNPFFLQALNDGPFLLLVNTIVITIIVLIFGEFLPKTLFRLFADEVLYFLVFPLSIFKWILRPLTWIINVFSNLILKRVLGAPHEKIASELTRLDLEHFVANSFHRGEEQIDKEIFSNVLNLNQLKVRDCMIPRNEIVYADREASIEEIVSTFKESGHSRILVIDGDIENVLGYIHHGQLFGNPKSIQRLIMNIVFVPEVMNVRDLLLRFIKERTNIACVVDEFGGISGLITLEDILEEIFGEIEDEHDTEDFIDKKISDQEYLFSGRLELSYLNEKYPELHILEGDYHTLSGYIVMTHGSIPEEGETIDLDNFKFVFEKVSDTKIETVRVIKLDDQQNPDKP